MHRMPVLLVALLVGTSLPSGGAVVAASHRSPPIRSASTTVNIRGITLSLRLPGAIYPHNALVTAQVSLTNHTRHTLSTWDCPAASLQAQVVGQGGVLLYPPLLPPPGAPWSACAGASASPGVRGVWRIRPGETVTRSTMVVLRSPAVRAGAELRLRPGGGKPISVETPLLLVRMTHLPGPRLTLRHGSTMSVDVTPASAGGPVLYSQFARCSDRAHTRHPVDASAAMNQWTSTARRSLEPFNAPPCTSLVEWSLFAAQPGRPVAHIYYCPRTNQCDYVPPSTRIRAIIACKKGIVTSRASGRLPASAFKYTIGMTNVLPRHLTPKQRKLARALHDLCARALYRRP